MSPQHTQRKEAIISGAERLLPNRVVGEGHNFMLSHDEAITVGNAVATRNHGKLRETLGEAVNQLEAHYDSFTIGELKGDWESSIQKDTGLEGDLLTFIDSPKHRRALDDILTGREGRKLSLRPITYVKLLETLAYATAPEGQEGFDVRYATSARHRRGAHSLHARALTMLENFASNEPGVRSIREGLLSGDESALDRYLVNLSRMRLAQKALAGIIEDFSDGRADEKRHDVRAQLEQLDRFDELAGSHILMWEMLPKEITESPDRNKNIKDIIKKNAKTREQKRLIEEKWHDERIDVLFDIAHLGASQGRDADIYISSTFDGGAGLYLAAALSHPLDRTAKIVVADNPLNGNALYIVDEQLTEFDENGVQYGWRDVLGQYKRIARDRGARRRYHTGDWSQLPRAVCEYGGNAKEAERKRREHEVTPHEDLNLGAHERLLAAIERAKAISDQLGIDQNKYK